MQIQDILAVISEEFQAVDRLIHQQLASRVPLVEKIADYIVSSGGKRIRPLLVLMTAKAFSECDERAVKLATVIEFLHTATLLHDDVVDTSDMRRGNPTANAKWGNASSVLVGDFLYSRSFEMLVELENLPVQKILATATSVIAEGEVLQLTNVKNPDTTEAQYMDVIQGKTAMLFEAATWGMASLLNRSEEEREAMRIYGRELGLAFQLIDDVLDYDGDAAAMGKNVGDDLAEGKPTLPLIHAMANGSEEQRKLVRSAIRKGGLEDMSEVLNIVHELGSIDYTRTKADNCVAEARRQLSILSEGPARDALDALALLAVQRNQ
ncbi:MAG: octaprenyl diphosphate synthase [Oceanospirillaceae bacterium]|uniref:polyprenyl synthetase family protein n=1 Tax=unclassified Thalassolituus TaxID=2624967 RepID=UPI000C3D4B06|nr:MULTISPECIES: polyprenyl synthetase family protein [unclassified Thalassolituus]MAS24620.1 octaprenyl diphosphate synthase [Oceanospirillaceae bacterium]MAY00925.1 octaprenyl diphosphate synthase [Oceanospirillaceae bacterium]MBS52718.1 octaprenyl diphosphate synthase [Oceanospirillaceae bacterium]|tara:strand:+ start:91 stop:1059 length:969 start_codon:yes stop_codon:yes gene_type:complete